MEVFQTTIATTNDAPLTVRETDKQSPHQIRPHLYRILAAGFLYTAIAFTGGYAIAALEDYRAGGQPFAHLSGVVK